MMDTRDRMEEIGGRGQPQGCGAKIFIRDFITKEEINACTSCNACVEAVHWINPLDIILQLRRYSDGVPIPASWNAMFQNVETILPLEIFSPRSLQLTEELKNDK